MAASPTMTRWTMGTTATCGAGGRDSMTRSDGEEVF
jgi:hypothetical protein